MMPLDPCIGGMAHFLDSVRERDAAILASDQFAAELARLGVPAPWRLCDEEIGEALAANGAVAFQVDVNRQISDEDASAIALCILAAVNTLAGLDGDRKRPDPDAGRVFTDRDGVDT